MSNFVDIDQLFAEEREAMASPQSKKPSSTRVFENVADFIIEGVEEPQKLVDALASAPHTTLETLRWNTAPDSWAVTVEWLDEHQLVFDDDRAKAAVVGKSLRQIKSAINHITSNFHASLSEAGISVYQRHGAWHYNEKQELVVRKNPPVVSRTQVSAEDYIVARMMMSVAKASTRSEKDKNNVVTSKTRLVPNNSLQMPVESKWAKAWPGLLVKGQRLEWAWAGYYSKFAQPEGFQIPPIDYLYWAYRVSTLSWVPVTMQPPPDFVSLLPTIEQVPWDVGQIAGFTKFCLWKDGMPVPSAEALWSAMKLCDIKSVAGNYPKSLMSHSKGVTYYGLAVSPMDPNARNGHVSIGKGSWLTCAAECLWSPEPDMVSLWKGTGVALPLGDTANLLKTVSRWCKADRLYRFTAVYCSNPTIIVERVREGVKPATLYKAMKFASVAARWVPFWNMAHAMAGGNDVWCLTYTGTFAVHYADTLDSYRFVALTEKTSREDGIAGLMDEAELSWDFVRVGNASRGDPVLSPCYDVETSAEDIEMDQVDWCPEITQAELDEMAENDRKRKKLG